MTYSPTAYFDPILGKLCERDTAVVQQQSASSMLEQASVSVATSEEIAAALEEMQQALETGINYQLIQWDANGGDPLTGDYTQGEIKGMMVDNLYHIVPPDTPTRANHIFLGWNCQISDATNPRGLAVRTYTFVALWEIVAYHIRFVNQDGTLISEGDIPAGEQPTPDTPSLADDDDYIYEFIGWTDGTTDYAPTDTLPAAAQDITYTARYQAWTRDIVLKDDGDTDYYNTFKRIYDGHTVNTATYNRTFSTNWATLCLPFDVPNDQLSASGLLGYVYEVLSATGGAGTGEQVIFNFNRATEMKAGQGYLVRDLEGTLTQTSFVFTDVTIDLSKDTDEDVNNLDSHNRTQGDIELIGILRHGTLYQNGEAVMALSGNKMYYPNSETGNNIHAYRGYFKDYSKLESAADTQSVSAKKAPARLLATEQAADTERATIEVGGESTDEQTID